MAAASLTELPRNVAGGYARLATWFFELPSTTKRPVLTLIVFLIVVFPALLYKVAERTADRASDWVTHTYHVEGLTYRLLFDLRDIEGRLRNQVLGYTPTNPLPADPLAALHADLDEIARQTLDNPLQQERIGQLRAIVDGRIDTLEEGVQMARTGKQQEALDFIHKKIAEAYPFRTVTDAILAEEHRLLQVRSADADHKHHLANAILWSAVVAQLLLCATIYLISEGDLARRRAAEELSREASAHAETIVESNPDPLIVLDRHARVRHVNRAFTVLYGTGAAEARGLFLRETGKGAWDLPELHHRLLDLIPQNREIWDWEVTQNQEGGAQRVMLLNARTFPGVGGQPLILLSAKDVTARKRSEEQILRLNQELTLRIEQAQAVNEELEAFSYSVSHDLRAPLRHITGFGDMLKSHLQAPDAKTERFLGYILESADQMGTLIDDLLVFSRMGRTEMTQREVDMDALVAEVIRYYELETEGRKITFQVDPLPSAKGDASMLRLVWMNLIGNAIKYSRGKEEARIEIGAKPSDAPEKIYFVRDNGVGFNMKYAHKLFGVFQRLHQADEYEGTGIGLANVRRIVQRHGGKVWGEGAIDQGATFSFSLPINPPAVAHVAIPPRGVRVNGPTL